MPNACVQCSRPLPPKHTLYCSNRCRGLGMRKGRPASTAFVRFLVAKMAELHLTQGAFAREVGVAPATMTRWLQGTAPLADAYARLRSLYGEEVPVVLTETDRRRAHARENLVALNGGALANRQREGARKGGAAGKGKPKPAHSEAMRAWHASEAGGEHRQRLREVTGPRLTQYVKTDRGRGVVSLGQFLRHNPHLLEARSKAERRAVVDEVRALADSVAKRLSLTGEKVFEHWKPVLRARGLPVGVGHPESTAVWEAVDGLRAAGMPWPQIPAAVGYLPEQVETVKRGYRRWRLRQKAREGYR